MLGVFVLLLNYWFFSATFFYLCTEFFFIVTNTQCILVQLSSPTFLFFATAEFPITLFQLLQIWFEGGAFYCEILPSSRFLLGQFDYFLVLLSVLFVGTFCLFFYLFMYEYRWMSHPFLFSSVLILLALCVVLKSFGIFALMAQVYDFLGLFSFFSTDTLEDDGDVSFHSSLAISIYMLGYFFILFFFRSTMLGRFLFVVGGFFFFCFLEDSLSLIFFITGSSEAFLFLSYLISEYTKSCVPFF